MSPKAFRNLEHVCPNYEHFCPNYEHLRPNFEYLRQNYEHLSLKITNIYVKTTNRISSKPHIRNLEMRSVFGYNKMLIWPLMKGQ